MPELVKTTSTIQQQVKLPFSVAVGVVMRGLRIRFGRSVVTIMGVVFGIAFLMAILSGIALKQGVEDEDRIRTEVNRMLNFLTAETGPLGDKVLGLVAVGPLSEVERRLLQRAEREQLTRLNITPASRPHLPAFRSLQPQQAEGSALGEDSSALLLVGNGPVPNLDWERALSASRQRVVATTLPGEASALVLPSNTQRVQLNRELRPEEIERMEADARKARFRSAWIVIISLFVTVIGISNAMLMSVTERFREIGTMKCLGALSSFVRTMFLIESAFVGIVGGIIGCLVGLSFSVIAYTITYGWGLISVSLGVNVSLLLLYLVFSLIMAIILSIVAAIYPATVASRMVPADALRSNV